MSNFFSNHAITDSKIRELMHQIYLMRFEDDRKRREYWDELRKVISDKPNLSAAHIAALMTDDLDERKSIEASISGLAYAAEDSKSHHPHVKHPSMPELKRQRRTVTRRFIEVADDGSVIGEFKVEERKYTYSIGV